jgi:hypothetical protein
MTGFGGDPKISRRLHNELVKRLREAIDRGIEKADELDAIVNQIVARSSDTDEIETVDILPRPAATVLRLWRKLTGQ